VPSTLLGHSSRIDTGIDSDVLKLVFYIDPHLISSSIRSRIDDYPINALNKIAFILNHAKSINANAILCGGDFFHSASMDNATQDGYLANVSFVLNSISIPYYSMIGNIPVLSLLLIRLFVNGWFLITHQCLYLRVKQ
jgi:hypothetical protein